MTKALITGGIGGPVTAMAPQRAGIDIAGRADRAPMRHMVMWNGRGKQVGKMTNGIELDDGTVSRVRQRQRPAAAGT